MSSGGCPSSLLLLCLQKEKREKEGRWAEKRLMDKNGQVVDETSEMMEESTQLVGGFCSTIKDLAPIYPEIHQFRAPPPPTFGRGRLGKKIKRRPGPSLHRRCLDRRGARYS